MKKLLFISVFVLCIASCDNTTTVVDQEVIINIVPRPQNTSVSGQVLILSPESKVYVIESHYNH